VDACVLTATMCNYARLRRLWLKDRVLAAGEVWPHFAPAGPRFRGFAPRRSWPVDELVVVGGQAIVAATGDESDPAGAAYDDTVPPWWRYQGRAGTQYWRSPITPGLRVAVNGRSTYWASTAPIPGGIAYENFELQAPFREGQLFTFGVTDEPPWELPGVGGAWPSLTPQG
jgi:hypothetical protein